MKKIFLILVFVLAFAVQGWAGHRSWGTQQAVDVRVAPNVPSAAGTLAWGTSSANQIRDFLTNNHAYRIRQNCNVTKIKLYVRSFATELTNLDTFKLKIWRHNGETWDKVGESENLKPDLSLGVINTITLASPIPVQEGDFYGYTIISGAGGGSQILSAHTSVGTDSSYYKTGSEASDTGHDWSADTTFTGLERIELLTDKAPQMVAIGDSIAAGHPDHYSFIEDTDTTDLDGNAWHFINISRAVVWQNMGVGGDTTADVITRIANDSIDLSPNYVIILVGVNDNVASVTQSTYLANMVSILDTYTANSIKPIVIKLLPWTNGTTLQLQTRDAWMDALEPIVTGYADAKWVDLDFVMGKFRTGGDTGNLWDYKDGYSTDNVHPNTTGYEAMGEAIDLILKTPYQDASSRGQRMLWISSPSGIH